MIHKFVNLADVGRKIAQKLELGLGRVQLPVLDYAFKSVAHDGNEHIQHGHLTEKSRTEKYHVANPSLGAMFKVCQIPIAQSKQVLIDDHIWNPPCELLIYKIELIAAEDLQHAHWDAKHDHTQAEKDQESWDCVDRLFDKKDVEGGLVEEPHPV